MNNNFTVMNSLKENVGSEVIIICPKAESFEKVLIGTVEVCDQLVEAADSLIEYPAVDSLDYGVLHGVLTEATTLPASIPKGVKTFLLLMDEDHETGGAFEVKSKDVLGVAEEIQELVAGFGGNSAAAIDIEQIYIIYGYAIQTMLTIDESTVDDEVLSEAKEMLDTIPETEEMHFA